MTVTHQDHTVDMQTVADRCGVKLDTVHKWRRRKIAPPPDGFHGQSPWWWWKATMLPWLLETGRITPEEGNQDG